MVYNQVLGQIFDGMLPFAASLTTKTAMPRVIQSGGPCVNQLHNNPSLLTW